MWKVSYYMGSNFKCIYVRVSGIYDFSTMINNGITLSNGEYVSHYDIVSIVKLTVFPENVTICDQFGNQVN